MSFDLGLRFVRRWLLLLLLGPLVGGVAGFLVVRGIPSVYQATVTLVVQPGDMAVVAPQDLQVAQDLAQTYAEAAHTRRVLTEAAAQVGLSGLSARDLDSRVQTRRVAGTQLLRISADDTDPQRAADLANAVARVFITTNAELQANRYATSRENLTSLLDRLDRDIEARQSTINDLASQPATPERDAQLAQLQDAMGQVRSTQYNTVRSLEDLRVSEARRSNTAAILDAAVPPETPVRPSRLLTTVFAAIAGLLVAAASALLAEYLDDRPLDPERVSRRFGIQTVGLIPATASSRKLHEQSGTPLESYRVLRSRLSMAMASHDVQSLLIASAVEGEGKTTIAAHLAMTLAETGNRVVLIDADLHRPGQMRLFDLPNDHGLTDLLLDEARDTGSVLQSTWLPNLSVVTSGQMPLSALLASKRMRSVLEELGSQHDMLVIDTPPVLAQPDAVILSAYVDAVLFVVDARRTRGRQAAKALELLRGCGAHVLGAVINRGGRASATYERYESSEPSTPSAPESVRRLSENGLSERAAGVQTDTPNLSQVMRSDGPLARQSEPQSQHPGTPARRASAPPRQPRGETRSP